LVTVRFFPYQVSITLQLLRYFPTGRGVYHIPSSVSKSVLEKKTDALTGRR
jgi:hypothetical protein